MIVKTLVENISNRHGLEAEHGLSLYIETKTRKILFDLGHTNLFEENARKLGVDIEEVDTVIISHGHIDHGGGLRRFLEINRKAKIYMNENAFGDYYANRKGGQKSYIGLEKELKDGNRMIFVGDYLKIDESFELFSNIKGDARRPLGNRQLFMKVGDEYLNDDFKHEQNLVINEDGNRVIIAGCAHNGIVNIVREISSLKGQIPTHVIGGFHLYSRSTDKSEPYENIVEIAKYLKSTDAKYYTCHCTGVKPYGEIRKIIGERMEYLSTGDEIII